MNKDDGAMNSHFQKVAMTSPDKTRLKLVRETVTNIAVRSGLRAGAMDDATDLKCRRVGESQGGGEPI